MTNNTISIDKDDISPLNKKLDFFELVSSTTAPIEIRTNCIIENKGEVKNFKLSGGFDIIGKDGKVHKVYLTKVIYSKPVVVAFWSDGTKTSCKVQYKDNYSCDAGIAFCALKKMVGSDKVADILKYWTPELDDLDDVINGECALTISLKDVRKKEKAEGRLK